MFREGETLENVNKKKLRGEVRTNVLTYDRHGSHGNLFILSLQLGILEMRLNYESGCL